MHNYFSSNALCFFFSHESHYFVNFADDTCATFRIKFYLSAYIVIRSLQFYVSARQSEFTVITCRFRNRFAHVTFIGRTAVCTVQRVCSELCQIILLRRRLLTVHCRPSILQFFLALFVDFMVD